MAYCAEYNTKLNKDNFIGKGAFSKAYRVGEKVVLLSVDNVKECIALFCQDESVHIPTLTRLADIGEYDAYEMPYYKPLRKSSVGAWSDYKALKKVIDCICYIGTTRNRRSFDRCQEALQNGLGIRQEIKDAVFILLDNMANYTEEIFLEISPRNVKVDDQGNLVLLDIIVDSNKLKEVRESRK